MHFFLGSLRVNKENGGNMEPHIGIVLADKLHIFVIEYCGYTNELCDWVNIPVEYLYII